MKMFILRRHTESAGTDWRLSVQTFTHHVSRDIRASVCSKGREREEEPNAEKYCNATAKCRIKANSNSHKTECIANVLSTEHNNNNDDTNSNYYVFADSERTTGETESERENVANVFIHLCVLLYLSASVVALWEWKHISMSLALEFIFIPLLITTSRLPMVSSFDTAKVIAPLFGRFSIIFPRILVFGRFILWLK